MISCLEELIRDNERYQNYLSEENIHSYNQQVFSNYLTYDLII